MLLFPRAKKADASKRYAEIVDSPISELHIDDFSISDHAVFAQTGGQRVSPDSLRKIRESFIQIAKKFGFPGNSSERQKADFDAVCALLLLKKSGIAPGEGFRDDIWAYLTLEVFPDIAAWRFPNRNERRFLGGVRNTFQRLWRRAFLLDYNADQKSLLYHLRNLQEDSFVQLVERPGFSANPYVASRIAAAWVRASRNDSYGPMEAIHRNVMKELTQTGAVLSLDSLHERHLDEFLDNLYREFGSIN